MFCFLFILCDEFILVGLAPWGKGVALELQLIYLFLVIADFSYMAQIPNLRQQRVETW